MNSKIIFMGTPQMAVPSLNALADAGFEIVLAVSQPDKPKGRGGKVQFTPVKEAALARGIEVYQPLGVRVPEVIEKLQSYKPDFLAVVAYGKILPQAVLDIPKYAPINAHFSLLPQYRGAAPVNWAIFNGDKVTGVTTMKMDAGMDTGDILLTCETPILRKDAVELSDELAQCGAGLLVKTLKEYSTITPRPQPDDGYTVAPMLTKELGVIDWNEPAASTERKLRALVPWPTAYTSYDGKMMKIFRADVEPGARGKPGVVYAVSKGSISVGTGDGGLVIQELQAEGKRRMSVADFLAGNKVNIGDLFG